MGFLKKGELRERVDDNIHYISRMSLFFFSLLVLPFAFLFSFFIFSLFSFTSHIFLLFNFSIPSYFI